MLDLVMSDLYSLADPNFVKMQWRLLRVVRQDSDYPFIYALPGCGRRCATLFLGGNGPLPLDTETVSELVLRSLNISGRASDFSACQLAVRSNSVVRRLFSPVNRYRSRPASSERSLNSRSVPRST